ncbi:MAG: hypothetical protein ACR2H0_03520 [Candidatus Limnocylindrales bacterium]
MKLPILLVALTIIAIGCAGPASTPGAPTASPRPATSEPATVAPPSSSPTDFRHGPEGLIADLSDAGADAEVSDSFDGEPLAAVQTIVCVNGEDVRVFAYGTEQERVAASAGIDPTDPSHVGTSIVEWDGWPKFWQRDRILVLYLGRDEATIDLLTELMGDPFAQGLDRPQRLPGAC